MFKKSIFALSLCLALGVGVLHASSSQSESPRLGADDAAAVIESEASAPQCLPSVAPEVSVDTDAALDTAGDAEAFAGYQCPPTSSYCRKDADCDQANGEVCERGCCLAAF